MVTFIVVPRRLSESDPSSELFVLRSEERRAVIAIESMGSVLFPSGRKERTDRIGTDKLEGKTAAAMVDSINTVQPTSTLVGLVKFVRTTTQ